MHITMQGYKAQSEMVLESLDKLIGACEARHESMVVEGVHLSLNAVIRLMQKHPSIVPFLVHISNEAKHRERFAVGICLRITVPRLQCMRKEKTVLSFIQPYLRSRGHMHNLFSHALWRRHPQLLERHWGKGTLAEEALC